MQHLVEDVNTYNKTHHNSLFITTEPSPNFSKIHPAQKLVHLPVPVNAMDSHRNISGSLASFTCQQKNILPSVAASICMGFLPSP
jgi:hypothetical protein